VDLILSIEAFVRVAETQSFANASRQIGVAKSVVTTRVKQLEEYLGVALFHRSTRAVNFSESGEPYYRDCSDLRKQPCVTQTKRISPMRCWQNWKARQIRASRRS
jgi:hypothetical protein